MTFIEKIEKLRSELIEIGYLVTIPKKEEANIDWETSNTSLIITQKREFIDAHILKIRHSDAVVVANYAKHDVVGYVGPNTLMEAAFGHCLDIPVYFLFDPIDQNCGLECAAISSGHLNGAIENIASFVPPSN